MRGFLSEFFHSFKGPLFLFIGILLCTIIALPFITYAYFAQDFNKEAIMNRNKGGITFLDRNEKPFFTFYQPRKVVSVPLNDISLFVQQAVIASEDRNFYQNPGFSLRGMVRATVYNIVKGDLAYGGSTITQQLVKNAFLGQEKTFLRKYKELILAYMLERTFSKQDILEMYLNSVYFGEGAFGIENAARTYFSKPAKHLTLGESAFLVGLIPAPSRLSPISHGLDKAEHQKRIVLRAMAETKVISQAQALRAEEEKILLHPKPIEEINYLAPHFALYVKHQLIKQYGEEYIQRSGFVVKTSLDMDLQIYAEQMVAQQVRYLARNNVTNGAAIVMDPKTGEILAYVGSHDWDNTMNGKVDMANSPRQPGSSFKPIIYAAGFEKRLITPATILQDQPITFRGGYKPLNYDRGFRGPVLVRRALATSLNVPAVEVMEKVGVSAGLETAKRLGISTLQDTRDYGLSLVLGSGEVKLLELTGVYATFANQGRRNAPQAILSIMDRYGKTIFTYIPQSQQMLDSGAAYLVSSILSDSAARAEAFGGALTISRPAAVKTGTSEDYRNALTLGYTPSIAVGVWVGNNDNSSMERVAGSLGAAPLWRRLMEKALSGKPLEQFEIPFGVQSVFICGDSGLKARNKGQSVYAEYFLRGTEPMGYCDKENTPTPTISLTPIPTYVSPTQTPTETEIYLTPTPTEADSNQPSFTPTFHQFPPFEPPPFR